MAGRTQNVGDAVWTIRGDLGPLESDLRRGTQAVNRSTTNIKRDSLIVGAAMAATGAAILGGLGKAAQASISFEAAFTGVRKTVEATEAEFAIMRRGLIELSRVAPVSAVNLAEIATVAGQIGVKQKDIIDFTKTIADLEVTTNIAGEQGALMVARFLKINDIPNDQIRRIASGIVFLGQSAEATESEILTMAQRLSVAGKIAGLTVGEILGLATSLVSVGVQAQLGGTNMSKIIRKMDNDFRRGGDSMKTWAKVAGVSAAEFRRVYGEEGAAKALTMMLVGLSKVQQSGGDYAKLVDEMGLKGERLITIVGAQSLTVDSLAGAMADGNRETQNSNAINKEAALFYGTSEAKLILLRTAVDGVARAIGDSFNVELKENSDSMSQYLNNLEDLITKHPKATKVISGTAAGFGLLGVAMVPLAASVIVGTALKGILVAAGLSVIGFGLAWASLGVILTIGVLQIMKAADAFNDLEDSQEALAKKTEETNKRMGTSGKNAAETFTQLNERNKKETNERIELVRQELSAQLGRQATLEEAWAEELRRDDELASSKIEGARIVVAASEAIEVADRRKVGSIVVGGKETIFWITKERQAAADSEDAAIKSFKNRQTAMNTNVRVITGALKSITGTTKKTTVNVSKFWDGASDKVKRAILNLSKAAEDGTVDIDNAFKELDPKIQSSVERIVRNTAKISPHHKQSPSLVEQTWDGLNSMADAWGGFASFVSGIISNLLNLVFQLGSAFSSIGISSLLGAVGIPGFAGGGTIRSPLAVVGERGPELIANGQGSQVFSASDTRDILSGLGGGGVTIDRIEVNVNTGGAPVHGDTIAAQFAAGLRERLVLKGVQPIPGVG